MPLYRSLAALLFASSLAAQTPSDTAHIKSVRPRLDTLSSAQTLAANFCTTKTAKSYPTLCKAITAAGRQFSSAFAAEQLTNFVYVVRVDTVRSVRVDTVRVVDTVKSPADTLPPVVPVDTVKKPPVDTTTIPPPPPSPGHPNEPSGFTKLSPTFSCDTVPLATSGNGAAYELGWVQKYENVIHIVIDSTVPFASKKVCEATFPSGFIGGTSPGVDLWTYQSGVNPENWGAMVPPRNPKSMYMSFWYKVSPKFPANLNANKVIYPRVDYGQTPVITMFNGSADYPMDASGYATFVPNGATQYNAALFPSICFQEVEIDGNHFAGCTTEQWFGSDPSKFAYLSRGVWHHYETLYTLEAPGKADGSAKLWLDGHLAVNWDHRVRFMPADQTTNHVWSETIWGPVYGGGGSVPNDGIGGYHRMKDMYVSGNP